VTKRWLRLKDGTTIELPKDTFALMSPLSPSLKGSKPSLIKHHQSVNETPSLKDSMTDLKIKTGDSYNGTNSWFTTPCSPQQSTKSRRTTTTIHHTEEICMSPTGKRVKLIKKKITKRTEHCDNASQDITSFNFNQSQASPKAKAEPSSSVYNFMNSPVQFTSYNSQRNNEKSPIRP